MVKWFIETPKGFAELNNFGPGGWRSTMRTRVHMVVADGISCVCSLDAIMFALLHNAYIAWNQCKLRKIKKWKNGALDGQNPGRRNTSLDARVTARQKV